MFHGAGNTCMRVVGSQREPRYKQLVHFNAFKCQRMVTPYGRQTLVCLLCADDLTGIAKQLSADIPEHLAAVLKVPELVKAGTRRAQQNSIPCSTQTCTQPVHEHLMPWGAIMPVVLAATFLFLWCACSCRHLGAGHPCLACAVNAQLMVSTPGGTTVLSRHQSR